MANKYTIRYTATFIKQFNNISKYIIYKLQNRIAAESFYYEVINEICFTFFVYTYIIRVISIFRSKKWI